MEKEVRSTLDMSNTDISKFPLISKIIIGIHDLFLFPFKLIVYQTTHILKLIICDLKINFEISVLLGEFRP